ncbi:MAG: hypothetical protein VXW32_11040 [Myxococcota bacterium]|nr:hypothetical protein [Myxococcota bacterium]
MALKRLIAVALATSACSESSVIPPRFDGPFRGDVLDVAEGPFAHPIGVVANTRSGQILAIDLNHGWLFSESFASPFVASNPIALGANRVLGEVIVHSSDAETVDLFAVDVGGEVLLVVPWIVGKSDSGFLRPNVTISEPVVEDAAETGDAVKLINLQGQTGYSTTEDWTLSYEGPGWRVRGSASGPQETVAYPGIPYRSDAKGISFTLLGAGSPGDVIRFSTDTGIVGVDVGGTILEARKIQNTGGLALLSVRDRFDETGRLVFFDLNTATPVGELPLPEGSQPFRFSVDEATSTLYVSDTGLNLIHRVELDAESPVLSAVSQIPVGFPVSDLAYASGDGFSHLFLARSDRNEVIVWDLLNNQQKDVNPSTERIDGIALDAPVLGMATSRQALQLPETTGFGANYQDSTVAISTFAGELWLAEASTGCFVQTAVGPFAYTPASGFFFDEGAPSNPSFEDANGTAEAIEVSACGGVVFDEDWTLTYVEALGAWQVEGSLSGVQERLAVEDERYVSDTGSVSFMIVSGSAFSTQGDQLVFSTRAGLAVANGDTDGDGAIEVPLENPGRPVPYEWRSDLAEGESWYSAPPHQGFLWPIGNSDVALLVDAGTGETEALLD